MLNRRGRKLISLDPRPKASRLETNHEVTKTTFSFYILFFKHSVSLAIKNDGGSLHFRVRVWLRQTTVVDSQRSPPPIMPILPTRRGRVWARDQIRLAGYSPSHLLYMHMSKSSPREGCSRAKNLNVFTSQYLWFTLAHAYVLV